MVSNGKDLLIEEIDKELRAIDAKLNKVLSKTDELIKDKTNETKETVKIHNDDENQLS